MAHAIDADRDLWTISLTAQIQKRLHLTSHCLEITPANPSSHPKGDN